MFKSLTKKSRKRARKNKSGQAVTEYASIIAFVSVLIVMVFILAPGRLGPALSQAFSSTTNQLNLLAAGS